MLRNACLAVIAVTSVAHADSLALSLDANHVFAASPAFPLVSADGKTLAELFVDAEDFSGLPTTTLVMWSTTTGRVTASFHVDTRTADSAKELARANAALAKLAWHAATIYTPSTETSLAVGGVTFTYADDQLSYGTHRVSFSADSGIVPVEHGCSPIPRGIERAFGAGKLVVLVPLGGSVGGDACAILPDVDRALAIVL